MRSVSKKRIEDYDSEPVPPSNWTPSPHLRGNISTEGDTDGAYHTNQSVSIDICARLSQQSIGADDA